MKMIEVSQVRVKAAACTLILPFLLASPAAAQDVETIIVSGSILKDKANLPGSAFEILTDDLARQRPISVGDLLQGVPGIQVVSEDLFGLKVNISVRGLTPRRSARTLLLEDGMPIQPAPYSEPSAHYVPPFERIERIEVLKGSGEIMFGPQSLGGMINFITKPVPDHVEGQIEVAAGTRDFWSGHVMLGAGNEQGGATFNILQKQSDGIRDGHATQFTDVAFKAIVKLGDRRTLTARFTSFVEDTALTEAGLDAKRYSQNPFSNPFANDHFDLTRKAVQLVYDAGWGAHISSRTQIYAAETFRASYRQTDTSTDTMTANPATGCEGNARTDYENFAARCGNKMRPRQFSFSGIETTWTRRSLLWGQEITSIIGARLHYEDADRRRYNGLTPTARETSQGTLLRDLNKIQTEAAAVYAQTTWRHNDFSFSAGVRNEDIQTTNTSVVANFLERSLRASSHQNITLPGFGLTWAPQESFVVFAGVHRGFAPPRPDRDVDPLAPANQVRPEQSTNYEVGMRRRLGEATQIEATAFLLDFKELIVAGPLLGLASGTLINAGEATHAGGEIYLKHEWLDTLSPNWKPWITLSGTYLANAEFDSNVGEGAASVRGNRIPYAPNWLGDLSLGVTGTSGLGVTLGVHYVGEQFADARNTIAQSVDGTLGKMSSYGLVNLGLTYQPKGANWDIYLSAHNMLDRRYLSTRTDGMFAGPPRQVLIGFRRHL